MTILSFSLTQRRPWDLAGIGASSVCVIHCLAMPLLVVFLPILEAVEKQTHAGFALTILGIGLLAFWQGYLQHRRWRIIAAAIVGFGLISLGVTAQEGLLSESAEARWGNPRDSAFAQRLLLPQLSALRRAGVRDRLKALGSQVRFREDGATAARLRQGMGVARVAAHASPKRGYRNVQTWRVRTQSNQLSTDLRRPEPAHGRPDGLH